MTSRAKTKSQKKEKEVLELNENKNTTQENPRDTLKAVTQGKFIAISAFRRSQAWWCTLLILVFGRQRQADLCELEASLIYTESSRTARAVQRDSDSKKQPK